MTGKTPADVPAVDHEPLSEAPPLALQEAQRSRLEKAWAPPPGWRYWSEVNNTEVGLWYTVATFVFFLFGGVLALIMRVQLASSENDLVSAKLYDQLFTMHGSIMMFLFAVPVFEAFSIIMLPRMLAARDLPFPRLSAFGFWCYIIGGVFFCSSIFFGIAPEGGWFMYPPLTTQYKAGPGTDVWLLALAFIEIASIAAAVELIVSVLRCRPPGMRINLMPLYAWYILVVGIMILFAFPPLIAGDVLLELERFANWPFFDAARGGDPLLWQHLFWIFGHPEVYIVFLPSVALIAMMVPTFAGTPIVGYTWIVLAALGTGFLSFGLWVHHMFTTGLPGISLGLFSAASQAIAIPTGIQFFCFIATLLVGKVTYSIPMLFVLGGFSTFIIGGLTGVMVALVPFDLQAHDTYFIVGHLHSVLIGGVLFPIAGAVHYYFPLIGGKQLSRKLGRWSFVLLFVGFNVTFVPMHITGMLGMPRRIYTYPPNFGFDTLNAISTVGAFIMAAGIAVFIYDIARPKKNQQYSARNPWNAGTLEWLAEMPDKRWGVRSIPEIDGRYPLWQQPNFMRDVDEGRFFLPDAEEGRRETILTSMVDAKPVQVLRVPGPTFITLVSAVFVGGAFIFSTFHLWWLTAGCSVAALAAIIVWLWTGTAVIPEKSHKDVGLGVKLPLYTSGAHAVGYWGMLITMLGDMVAYISLVFGYFFYWTVQPQFPPANAVHPDLFLSLAALVLAVVAWGGTWGARELNRKQQTGGFYAAVTAATLAALGSAWALFAALDELDPSAHVYPAVVCVLFGWTALHLLLGVVMHIYCFARRLAGKMTPTYDADIANVTLYWHFAMLTMLITSAVVLGFPLLS